MSGALPSVPSFSEHQVHDLANIVRSVVQQYFAPSNQPLSTPPPQTPPASTSPAPQEAQKEEDEQLQKQEQQPLQQATVENTTESITESITKHGSSIPDRKSTLSAIPRLCTVRSSEDSATRPSNALRLACQHINTLLGYTLLGSNLPGYIEHLKGLEATGQG